MVDKNIRGRIALISISAFLLVGGLIILIPLTGFFRSEDAITLLNGWGAFAGLPLGAVLGFYFGTSAEPKRY